MFQCAVGHSDDVDEADAVEAAWSQASSQLGGSIPGAALVFCGISYDQHAVLAAIDGKQPGLAMIGGTTDGEMSATGGYAEESVLIVLFASDEVVFRAGLGTSLSQDATMATGQAADQARHGDAEPALVFLVGDGLTSSGDLVVAGLSDRFGARVPMIGGLAGDKLALVRTNLFCGTEVVTDGVAVLALYGPLLIGCGVASGWNPIGHFGTVTRATGGRVEEIDGKPALAFFERYAGDGLDNTWMHAFPLAVWEADDSGFAVRAPIANDRDTGAVVFSGHVPEGARVQITEASRSRILEGTRLSATAALTAYPGEAPAAAFAVSCTSRHLMLGTETDQEVATLGTHLPAHLPIGGWYAYGEMAPLVGGGPTRFHNQSCVTVVVGER